MPADNPGALAGAIAACSTTPALRARLGVAGRARVVSRFTWQVTAAGTAACYRAVLDGEPLPGAPTATATATAAAVATAPPPTTASTTTAVAGHPGRRLMLTVDYDRLGVAPGDRLLDLGCGFGRHAFEAARRGADVVALDAGAGEVAQVRATLGAMVEAGELADGHTASAVQGDALALPFADGTFDRVIASEVLEHIPDDAAAMHELARVLRPGGTMAVTVPRCGPEAIKWALSDEYHDNPGGHVRIRRSTLERRLRSSGLVPTGYMLRRVPGQILGDLAAPVTHHHDETDRIGLARGGQHVPEQGLAADRVQNLRGIGLHPRTFARGQDDDRSRTAHTHLAVLLGCCSPDAGIPLPGCAVMARADPARSPGTSVHAPDTRRIPSGQSGRRGLGGVKPLLSGT